MRTMRVEEVLAEREPHFDISWWAMVIALSPLLIALAFVAGALYLALALPIAQLLANPTRGT